MYGAVERERFFKIIRYVIIIKHTPADHCTQKKNERNLTRMGKVIALVRKRNEKYHTLEHFCHVGRKS